MWGVGDTEVVRLAARIGLSMNEDDAGNEDGVGSNMKSAALITRGVRDGAAEADQVRKLAVEIATGSQPPLRLKCIFQFDCNVIYSMFDIFSTACYDNRVKSNAPYRAPLSITMIGAGGRNGRSAWRKAPRWREAHSR